jgi:hypothetical protein
VVNTLIGNDSRQWHVGAETYSRVRIEGAYPGIDLVYYGNQRKLEYDFVVAPGADPGRIRFEMQGGLLQLKPGGELAVRIGEREVIFGKPVVYQVFDGQRHAVGGRFVLRGRSKKGFETVGFEVGRFDRGRELVIDPVLSYSTYINGTSGSYGSSAVAAIAVDTAGEAFITGSATAISPTAGAFQGTDNNDTGFGGNAYVMKLNASGTNVVYATYLGGSGGFQILPPPGWAGDGGLAIAIDTSGDAYLTGFTYSQDFPLKNAVQADSPAVSNGNDTAFVTELNPTGTGLVYSTYLGGSGAGNGSGDYGTGIAVDTSDAAYVTGNALSPDFPTTAGALQTGGAIFIAKYGPNGTSQAYSTTFGTGYVMATGIAVDGSGSAYVTGYAFPQNGGGITATPGAYQQTNHSAYQTNAFVAKLNPTGTALGYATYLGGSGRNYTNSSGVTSNVSDQGNAIAVDGSGNAYITGSAGSGDFPITSGAIQTNNVSAAGFTNAFVTKLNPTGTALVYSTYLGGTGSGSASPGYGDQGNAIAVDTAGDAYVAGSTGSGDFPVTTNAYQSTNGALANKSTNAFVSKLNPAGSGLLFSTYLGGSGTASAYSLGDSASGVTFDTSGHIYVGGTANSSNFPTTSGAFETTGGGGFVSQLNPAAGSQYALSITPATLEVFAGQVGTPSNATPVTITNIGSADATISGISIAGANAAEFTQTNTCGATLEPNDSCTVSVIFTPTTAGKQSATLSIADNATGSPQSVALVGNETVYPPDPVLSATHLTFAPQAVGSSTTQTVTLTNQGTGPLNITSIGTGSWWSQTNTCGTTLAAGASCTISVIFTPPIAGASTTALLVVQDNANSSPQEVSLSGSGTAVNVVVSPLSLNFAAQAVGTTSPAQTVTVNNYSTVPITFSSISATGDFALTNNCNGPVPANSSCNALVTFKPTAPGTRTGTLTVTDSASNLSWQVALNGGVPPVTLTPTALTFAAQAVGTTSDVQIVKVANTGQGASYAISSIVVSGDFVWNKDLNFSCEGATLGLYGSCNVEVAFNPTAAGTRTGTLTITDTASNSPQTAALTGTGVGPVTLSATVLSFADQAVGSTSTAQTVTLTNSGQATLTIASIAASGDFAETNACGSSLAAGATCNIAVTFTPTAAGNRTGMLTVADNATGSPQTVALSGTGVTPELMLSPVSLSFGNQTTGTMSAARTVTLSNGGTGATTISSITASGDFSETNTCNGAVAAGGSCTVAVVFQPTATGSRTGTLTVTDNATGSPQTVAISGTGITPAPAVTLAPGSLSFAAEPVGTASTAQVVTLTNSGAAALAITSIAASGDFAQTNTCGNSVAAGANCSISVVFTPTDSGTRSGVLTMTDNAAGSPQTLALSGTGTSVSLTTSATTLSIGSPGGSATATITVGSLSGYSGTVMLTCNVQISGSAAANDTPACSLNPNAAQVANGQTTTATLTVTTTAARSSAKPAAAFMGGSAFGLLLLFQMRRVRKRLRGGFSVAGALILAALGLGAAGVLVGCGGGSHTPTDTGTSPGNYNVTVTATGSDDAAVTATSTIVLSVQ